ncbi:hypothetical protein [Salinibacillus aidingensis]|uniref:hypothetical protein n=1 Tax=Salinibacillus aidingensis TaxID=237684 RepID=UPI0031D76F5D
MGNCKWRRIAGLIGSFLLFIFGTYQLVLDGPSFIPILFAISGLAGFLGGLPGPERRS